MVLIQKAFLQKHGIKHSFGSVFAGRVCWLLFESDGGPPLYILASHIERFSVDMIASVRNKRIELGNSVGLALPRPGLGIMLGDYNFVNHHCNRWAQLESGPTVLPTQRRDLWAQRQWAPNTDGLVDYTLNEETFVRHTRVKAHLLRTRRLPLLRAQMVGR